MAGDAEPSPIISNEGPKENHPSNTSDSIQHNVPEVAEETVTKPGAPKCSEITQGNLQKNGIVLPKVKNFKAGFKINQLADKLAKRSLKVLEVGESTHESIPLLSPTAGSDSEPTSTSVRSEDLSLMAATPLPPITSNQLENFYNPSLPTKPCEELSNVTPESSSNGSKIHDSIIEEAKDKPSKEQSGKKSQNEEVPPADNSSVLQNGDDFQSAATARMIVPLSKDKAYHNVEVSLSEKISGDVSSQVPQNKASLPKNGSPCAGNVDSLELHSNSELASPSLGCEKPPHLSTAFNDTDDSTKERVKKRSSPRCKKELNSNQTDSVIKRGKTRKKPKNGRKLVEMATQTADIQFVSVAKNETPNVQFSSSEKDLTPNAQFASAAKVDAPDVELTKDETPLPPILKSPTFICLFCQLTFRDKTDCLNHEATHSLKRKTKFIKCQFCLKKLPNLEEFKSHSTKNHRANFHLCNECDLRFLNDESLVLHTQLDHLKVLSCEKTQFSILNKKVRISTSLDIDVSFDSTQKKQSISPRCPQKPSPKDKTEEYEAEMLFYSYLSGNIKENLSNHLDGKIDQFESNGENSEVSRSTTLLTVAPNSGGSSTVAVTRAPSPYQTRSKTPNPLPTSAKKFKKLPNWQQKFWEKYNFPTSYRFEHRFWDKNYINTERSALYLKDLSCLDIKTQLTMRENVKKLEDPKVTKDDGDERLKDAFPYMLNLIPQRKPVVSETSVSSKDDNLKAPKKKVTKEAKGSRRLRAAEGSTQVVTRQQKGIDGTRQRKGSLDLGGDKKNILRRQTSLENVGSPAKEKDTPSPAQESGIAEEPLGKSIMSGEWVRPRSYLCGACCTKFGSLWDLEDHKWLTHPNVYCTHYEFENDKVDNVFQLEASTPQVAPITLPDLYRRYLHPQGSLQLAESATQLTFPHSCSKCQKLSSNQADLHKHMLECGGDTTWALTMTASPATNKRRWKYGGGRRRKPTGQRGVKRNLPSTPTHRNSASLQPKIRTKPGDVESIQKMLANLPEKRTRRAINFDAVSTRSQTTIRSHRYLRKRLTVPFNRGFLRRKVLSSVRSKHLKAAADTDDMLTNADSVAARRRFRLKEVTVNVTPMSLPMPSTPPSPIISQVNNEPKIKRLKSKKIIATVQEGVEEPLVQPNVEKKKIAKRNVDLVKKIKKKLKKSKKDIADRRRSERIKGKDETSEETLNPQELKPKTLKGSKKKVNVQGVMEELHVYEESLNVLASEPVVDDATDEEVPIAKLVVAKNEAKKTEIGSDIVKEREKIEKVAKTTKKVVRGTRTKPKVGGTMLNEDSKAASPSNEVAKEDVITGSPSNVVDKNEELINDNKTLLDECDKPNSKMNEKKDLSLARFKATKMVKAGGKQKVGKAIKREKPIEEPSVAKPTADAVKAIEDPKSSNPVLLPVKGAARGTKSKPRKTIKEEEDLTIESKACGNENNGIKIEKEIFVKEKKLIEKPKGRKVVKKLKASMEQPIEIPAFADEIVKKDESPAVSVLEQKPEEPKPTSKKKPVKRKIGVKEELAVCKTKKVIREEIEDIVLPEIVSVDTKLVPHVKPVRRNGRRISDIAEMPVLNKVEPVKKRVMRKSVDLPVLQPADEIEDVKNVAKAEKPIVSNAVFKVVSKTVKRNKWKNKVSPLKLVKEQNGIENIEKADVPAESFSDSEPLIALKQQTVENEILLPEAAKIVGDNKTGNKHLMIGKKIGRRNRQFKRNVRRRIFKNNKIKQSEVKKNTSSEIGSKQINSKAVQNLMIEKIISDKLNERLGKHKRAIHRRNKMAPPTLKQLRMTVTLKEATLKVVDKQAPVSGPNKWTVSTPINNVISFYPSPVSTDLINPMVLNARNPEVEIVKDPVIYAAPDVENFIDISETKNTPSINQESDETKVCGKVADPMACGTTEETTVSTTSVEVDEKIVKVKDVIPIFTIEEATSSEDAKPSSSTSKCDANIAEADSSAETLKTTEKEKDSIYDVKVEDMEVTSTKPNLVKKRRKEKVVDDLESRDETPTSTLTVPEELDRRSRRRSKEIPTNNEFVIDDPLLLVDELWSDLDSDSDNKQKRKLRKTKKKVPKRRKVSEKSVDLEAILRNFGESKDNDRNVKCLPMRKERRNSLAGRQRFEQKIVYNENLRSRTSLRLFSFRKNHFRSGREGKRLLKRTMEVVQICDSPKAPILSSEITENPELVIVCRSTKPKAVKKVAERVEPPPAKILNQKLKVSLPLELLGDLPIINNNNLETQSSPVPQNSDCCARPATPLDAKPPTEAKPKRSEVIDKIFYCEICKTYYYSPSQLKNHKMSNRHKLKCEELGISAVEAKEAEKSVVPQEEEKEDTSEMPVLEGPFIEETKTEVRTDSAIPPQPQPSSLPPATSAQQSIFGFSEESLKDIQKAIGCTDEEMLILTLLGENTVPEPDILDISNFTNKSDGSKEPKPKSKTNGILKVDLKQRMTNALSSLVNRAVNNFLNKSELMPLKVSEKSDAATFLSKLSSGISNRRASFTHHDLAFVLESIPQTTNDLSEVRYKFQCTMCSNRFEKASTRDYHMIRKHRVGKRTKAASKEMSPPPEDWNDSSWYDCEDVNPTQSSQFLCSDCGINFLSPKEVLQHQKTEHPAEVTRPPSAELVEEAKPAIKRFLGLDPDQERLLANEALQKLVCSRTPKPNKLGTIKKTHCAPVCTVITPKLRKPDPGVEMKFFSAASNVPSDVPKKDVDSDSESLKRKKTKTSVDVYDFNEFDSDPEPVVLSHVRKSAILSQDKTSDGEKDDDSDDNLPLSTVVKAPKNEEIVETKRQEDRKCPKESLKVSLESKFLLDDDASLKKSFTSSSLGDDDSTTAMSLCKKSDDFDPPNENVIFQRNESMSSFDSNYEAVNSILSSDSETEDDNSLRNSKKIVPLLSATDRKSESPKLNKEVIVKKIWNRQKAKIREESPGTDVAKTTIMKKVWKKKKSDSDDSVDSVKIDEIAVSRTEISNEVVIKCGPKPKNVNRRRSLNEPAKDAIVRRIWSGKCGFQTKAALKTYDSDVFPAITASPAVQEASPAKRRGRPASVSAIKRRKVSSASEDDLDSLLEEIEQENVEKAIRSEFLHLRRTEKNPIDASKESAGLFAEIQPVVNTPEKKKRKIRKNVRLFKRKFDSNDLRNRRHRKHKHHHHKHKHKKSRHQRVIDRLKRNHEVSSSTGEISTLGVLERLCEASPNKGNDLGIVPEPPISSDLDNLDLKLDEILSPYDSSSNNKLNGDISDDEISFSDKNIFKT